MHTIAQHAATTAHPSLISAAIVAAFIVFAANVPRLIRRRRLRRNR